MHYQSFNQLPKDAFDIRIEVFVNEQGFTNEFDEYDTNSTHIVLYDNFNSAIGTCRYYYDVTQDALILGRIAIRKKYRKFHYGFDLVSYALETIKASSYSTVIISAQCQALGFFEKLGFQKYGEIYLDEHCPHIQMKKVLR